MARGTKRKATEIRQQQILEAAQEIIFKNGSEHLTVKRIAEMVGISEAAIYCHFKSKKSILLFLLAYIEKSLIQDITEGMSGASIVSLDTIDRIIRTHFSTIDLHKGISFQVIAEIVSLGDHKLNKQAAQTINNYISHLIQLLAAGVRDGTVRRDINLEAGATLLFTLIQGLVNMWALNEGSFKLRSKYDSLWMIYRDAIAAR